VVFGNQTDCTWPQCKVEDREWTWDGVVVAAASSERAAWIRLHVLVVFL
jgi:hypothetical protein